MNGELLEAVPLLDAVAVELDAELDTAADDTDEAPEFDAELLELDPHPAAATTTTTPASTRAAAVRRLPRISI
jgi:hypothetical protein